VSLAGSGVAFEGLVRCRSNGPVAGRFRLGFQCLADEAGFSFSPVKLWALATSSSSTAIVVRNFFEASFRHDFFTI
jgi:hypothetical protein